MMPVHDRRLVMLNERPVGEHQCEELGDDGRGCKAKAELAGVTRYPVEWTFRCRSHTRHHDFGYRYTNGRWSKIRDAVPPLIPF